jgi:hypothetical protein
MKQPGTVEDEGLKGHWEELDRIVKVRGSGRKKECMMRWKIW